MIASNLFRTKLKMKIYFDYVWPSEYKNIKFHLKYAFGDTKFGKYLLATCNKRICFIKYCSKGSEESSLLFLKKTWPGATYEHDKSLIEIIDKVFDDNNEETTFHVLLKGTKLQVEVWKELIKIPKGSTVTYNELADKVSNPRAIRAVASAVGKNMISYLLPCHRVVHKSGSQVKYGCGPELKLKILNYESKIAKFEC